MKCIQVHLINSNTMRCNLKYERYEQYTSYKCAIDMVDGSCCCRPTPPCLFGGVLPYLEVTGHPVSVFSQGFKCPDFFI